MNASSSLILITGAKDFPGMNSYNMATQVTKGFKWSQMAHNVFFCSNMIFFFRKKIASYQYASDMFILSFISFRRSKLKF